MRPISGSVTERLVRPPWVPRASHESVIGELPDEPFHLVGLVLCGPILGSEVDEGVPEPDREHGVLVDLSAAVKRRSLCEGKEPLELLDRSEPLPFACRSPEVRHEPSAVRRQRAQISIGLGRLAVGRILEEFIHHRLEEGDRRDNRREDVAAMLEREGDLSREPGLDLSGEFGFVLSGPE